MPAARVTHMSRRVMAVILSPFLSVVALDLRLRSCWLFAASARVISRRSVCPALDCVHGEAGEELLREPAARPAVAHRGPVRLRTAHEVPERGGRLPEAEGPEQPRGKLTHPEGQPEAA
ncbi:hypothetical protein ACFPRL_05895 [Pseudoclavibacter helvolus]